MHQKEKQKRYKPQAQAQLARTVVSLLQSQQSTLQHNNWSWLYIFQHLRDPSLHPLTTSPTQCAASGTTVKTHIHPRPLVPITVSAGTNVQI